MIKGKHLSHDDLWNMYFVFWKSKQNGKKVWFCFENVNDLSTNSQNNIVFTKYIVKYSYSSALHPDEQCVCVCVLKVRGRERCALVPCVASRTDSAGVGERSERPVLWPQPYMGRCWWHTLLVLQRGIRLRVSDAR